MNAFEELVVLTAEAPAPEERASYFGRRGRPDCGKSIRMALHKREDTPTNEKAGRAPVLGTTPLRHTLYDVSLGSGSSNTPGLSNGEGWIESLASLPRRPLVRVLRVRTRFQNLWSEVYGPCRSW